MPPQTVTAPPLDVAPAAPREAAMLVLDRDLRVVAADGGAMRDAAWPEQIVGRLLADLMPQAWYAAIAPRYRLAFEGRTVIFDHVAGDGRPIYRVTAMPVPDDLLAGRLMVLVSAVPRDDRLASTG